MPNWGGGGHVPPRETSFDAQKTLPRETNSAVIIRDGG
jgi:hypothetical protein